MRVRVSLCLLLASASSIETTLAFQSQTAVLSTTRFATKATTTTTTTSPLFSIAPDKKSKIDKITPEDLEAAAAAAIDDEKAFKQRTRELCAERNIPFSSIKNARDLSSCENSPIISGKVYRTGRVSDATETDICTLFDELQIKTLVDLRSPTELKDDPTLMREEVFGNFTNIVWKERRGSRRTNRDGCLRELSQGEYPIRRKSKGRRKIFFKQRNKGDDKEPQVVMEMVNSNDDDDEDCDCAEDYISAANSKYSGNRKERMFVSLMNEFKYVRGTLSKLRKRDLARTLLKSPGTIFSKRARNSIKKPFLDEINGGGLPMLNELLLRYGSPGIKYVLELCADPNRHPIAFYCTAGKDRTGMIAAIILSLCGCSKESIVEDYSLSANVYAEMNDHKAMVGALSQRSLDPKTFLGAPPHVMDRTLDLIEEQFGSVEGYCNWIGFGPEKQQQLREVLSKDYNYMI